MTEPDDIVERLKMNADMLKDGYQKNLTELWHSEVVRDAAKDAIEAAAEIERLRAADPAPATDVREALAQRFSDIHHKWHSGPHMQNSPPVRDPALSNSWHEQEMFEMADAALAPAAIGTREEILAILRDHFSAPNHVFRSCADALSPLPARDGRDEPVASFDHSECREERSAKLDYERVHAARPPGAQIAELTAERDAIDRDYGILLAQATDTEVRAVAAEAALAKALEVVRPFAKIGETKGGTPEVDGVKELLTVLCEHVGNGKGVDIMHQFSSALLAARALIRSMENPDTAEVVLQDGGTP